MTPEQLKEFRDIASSYTVTFKHTRLHERNSMNRELLDRCLDALESLNAMSYEVGKKLMDDIEAELDKPETEPYGYVSEHNCTGPFKHQFHLTQETIYPDNCKSITPVYLKW